MTDLVRVWRVELTRIFRSGPVFMVLVVAVLIYAVLYPQPYLTESLREVPIAVVDRDGTASSREFARRLDSTSDATVAQVLPDLPTGERAVYTREIFGIVVIPQNFERDLLHGRASPVALYADASYFLLYQRVSGAVSAIARTFGTEVEAARLVVTGTDPVVAVAAVDPMPFTGVALFNPQGGYATYILPAAFVLLVQQTLLIGVGLLGTIPGPDIPRRPNGSPVSATAAVTGKAVAYLTYEAVVVPFYLIALPYLYGIPRLGRVTDTLLFAIPFVLAVGTLGLLVAAIIRQPIMVQLVLSSIGLPFFFLAGFAWPREAMPTVIQAASLLVPSTSAIDGLVRLNQLGASLSDVRDGYFTLWLLAGIYGPFAILAEQWRRNRR